MASSSRKSLSLVVLALLAISCSALAAAAAHSDVAAYSQLAGGTELALDPFRVQQTRSVDRAAAGSRLSGGRGNPSGAFPFSRSLATGGRRSLLQEPPRIRAAQLSRPMDAADSSASLVRRSEAASCNKKPGVCRVPGTKTPACCYGKCVSLQTDPYHCGKCGRVVPKNLACCKGHAVDLKTSNSNCGKCGTRCPTGHTCRYGICNYAS